MFCLHFRRPLPLSTFFSCSLCSKISAGACINFLYNVQSLFSRDRLFGSGPWSWEGSTPVNLVKIKPERKPVPHGSLHSENIYINIQIMRPQRSSSTRLQLFVRRSIDVTCPSHSVNRRIQRSSVLGAFKNTSIHQQHFLCYSVSKTERRQVVRQVQWWVHFGGESLGGLDTPHTETHTVGSQWSGINNSLRAWGELFTLLFVYFVFHNLSTLRGRRTAQHT